MKKVAVLTTHRADNYGAALQSYALTHVARRLGADCEILDYRTPSFEATYHKAIPWGKRWRVWPALLHHRYIRDARTIKAFSDFRNQRMIISAESYTCSQQLEEIQDCYDLFLAGSDQIWNPAITGKDLATFDRTYLLDFVKSGEKKASYAASIGISNVDDALADVYRQYLSDYSTLTVREHRAAEILREILGRDVTPVCDPVLLMTGSEWQEVERPVALENDDYILVYNVCDTRSGMNMEQYAMQLAQERGCAVYFIQPPIAANVSTHKDLLLTGVGPAEFVWLIRNARELVTTSFHGTAFALTYGKRIHLKMEASALKTQRNSRILSLIRYFGLDEEQVQHGANPDYPTAVLSPEPKNQACIEAVRQFSTELLLKMIQ
ncbi:MAG: polysaccharide pyruvyl transferase family protein [Akkermansia sp.]|nr:polysaccharide pyruvyl transferase family protein [Akkermansia sp.]